MPDGEPRIGLIGRRGRMGAAIAALLPEPVAGIGRGGDVADLAREVDVLVDFSAPDALSATLDAARDAGLPVLIGTTGFDDAGHRAIDSAAAAIAVLQTGNTSLGVTLLARLVADAALALGAGWDVAIVEAHHRMKRDAPSGTALLLAEASGRDDVLFSSVRGGTVVGDHDVLFLGDGEQLRLAHRAEDRAIFARGALVAARWLVGRPPGRYEMADVLGL